MPDDPIYHYLFGPINLIGNIKILTLTRYNAHIQNQTFFCYQKSKKEQAINLR